jgi:hypothetical protein
LSGLWILPVEIPAFAPNITLDIPEKPGHFFSGEKVARTVVLKNQLPTVQDLVISWKTVSLTAVIQKGKTAVELQPGETKEILFTLKIPKARCRVELLWQISLFSNKSLLQEKEVKHTVFPKKLSFDIDKAISRSQVGLYDPDEEIKPYLKEFGWNLIPLYANIKSLEGFNGKLLILNGRALMKAFSFETDPQKFPFRDYFRQQIERGMNIIVFDPVFLENADAVPAGEEQQEPLCLSRIFALGHPVFYDLSEDDLCWWRKDGKVAGNEMTIKDWKGNLRILANDAGRQEEKAFLVEYPVGRGRWLFCSYDVLEKFAAEPVARILLANLVRYALTESEPFKKTLIAADPEGVPVKFFRELEIGISNVLDNQDHYKALIVSADKEEVEYLLKKNPRFFTNLKEFVRNGGLLLILNLNPGTLEHFKDLLPPDILLRDYSLDGALKIDQSAQLLRGVSEDRLKDLFMKTEGEQIDPENRIANYILDFKESGSAHGFTSPCAIAKFQLDKGEIVVSQIKFWESDKKDAALQTISQFLTNLGIQIGDGKEKHSG